MRFSLFLILLVGAVNVAEGYLCGCGWTFWFGNGNCYFFSQKAKLTWAHAEKFCRRQGGYLIKVNNVRENNWIRQTAKKISQVLKRKRIYFLGATDAQHEGHWRWRVDFSDVRIRGWGPGQPDNARKSQHCAVLWHHHHYSWDDQSCITRKYYICEKPAFGKPACKCVY